MNEKMKQGIFVTAVILFVAVVFTSISYSYSTGSLTINGNSKVTKNSWNVHFDNVEYIEKSEESGNVEISTTNDMLIEFKALLREPQDKYAFTIEVINDGAYDLKLDNILYSTLEDDEARDVEYIVTYENGDSLKKGDLLKSNNREKLRVVTRYKDEENVKDMYELYLFLKLSYVQDDGKGIIHDQN